MNCLGMTHSVVVSREFRIASWSHLLDPKQPDLAPLPPSNGCCHTKTNQIDPLPFNVLVGVEPMPPGFDVAGYPTIFFVPADNKKNPIP